VIACTFLFHLRDRYCTSREKTLRFPAVGETSVTAASAQPSRRADAAGQQDGRLTRAARTRAAVVEALLTLNDQGNLRPTARDIAAEAGVSLRSLYVHFDDLEALFVAASARHSERMAAQLPPLVAEGPLAERLEAFLSRRITLHEVGAGVRRAALLQEPFSPALRQALVSGRKLMRSEVRRAFGPELDAADADHVSRLLRGLDIASSSASWEALRTYQGLGVEEATDQVRDMMLAFLGSWGPAPASDPARSGPTTARARA
jgi:TetR/AcrR family transcriptional regulator, regulator of autoinduction and epiphytic fitness